MEYWTSDVPDRLRGTFNEPRLRRRLLMVNRPASSCWVLFIVLWVIHSRPPALLFSLVLVDMMMKRCPHIRRSVQNVYEEPTFPQWRKNLDVSSVNREQRESQPMGWLLLSCIHVLIYPYTKYYYGKGCKWQSACKLQAISCFCL